MAQPQKEWVEFLVALEKRGKTFENIKYASDRDKIITLLGCTDDMIRAVILTEWRLHLEKEEEDKKNNKKIEATKQEESIKYWESQKQEALEEKHYPHILKSAATRLEIEGFKKKIKDDNVKEMRQYRESLNDKIRARSIDAYDVFLLQYVLSEDKEKIAILAHLLLNKNTKEERVKLHNIMMFDDMNIDKRGDKGKSLEFLQMPLLNSGFGEQNNLLFEAAEKIRKNDGKNCQSAIKLYERVYQTQEEEITGGEVLLPVRQDGIVDATIFETEILRQRGVDAQNMGALQKQIEMLQAQVSFMNQQGSYSQRGRAYGYRGVGYQGYPKRGYTREADYSRGRQEMATYKGGEATEINNKKEN